MAFLTTFFLILKSFLGIFTALISIVVSLITAFFVEESLSNRNHQLLGFILGFLTFVFVSSILLTLWSLYGLDFFFGV